VAGSCVSRGHSGLLRHGMVAFLGFGWRDVADGLDPIRPAVIIDERDHDLYRRSSSAWACVDVYGPRPIATAGLIRIDGHNC
jgi:hypothetical protein